MELPQYMKFKTTGETVEVLKRGHYPDTVVVKDGQGSQVEVYIKELDQIN